MIRRCMSFLVLLLVVLAPAATLRAQGGANDAAAQKAITFIRTQQAADGTFAGFGAGSTADAIFALAAAGVDANTFTNGQASAVEGLTKLAPDAAKDPGIAAKFVLAALQVGQNPRALGGTDLVTAIEQSMDASTGRYGADSTTHTLSLLALSAVGSTIPPAAISALESLQLPDGGWSFDGTAATGSDTNTTALAIQALIATGNKGDALTKAIAYLRTQQNTDGGFPYSQTSQFGNASDANSTALSTQAIIAAGEDPATWVKEGKTPLDRLLAFQNDSGAFRYQDTPPDDNQLATYQAVPAALGKTLIPATAATTAPAAGSPSTLPNTGSKQSPLVPLIAAGLLMGAAGVVLRRRSA